MHPESERIYPRVVIILKLRAKKIDRKLVRTISAALLAEKQGKVVDSYERYFRRQLTLASNSAKRIKFNERNFNGSLTRFRFRGSLTRFHPRDIFPTEKYNFLSGLVRGFWSWKPSHVRFTRCRQLRHVPCIYLTVVKPLW